MTIQRTLAMLLLGIVQIIAFVHGDKVSGSVMFTGIMLLLGMTP